MATSNVQLTNTIHADNDPTTVINSRGPSILHVKSIAWYGDTFAIQNPSSSCLALGYVTIHFQKQNLQHNLQLGLIKLPNPSTVQPIVHSNENLLSSWKRMHILICEIQQATNLSYLVDKKPQQRYCWKRSTWSNHDELLLQRVITKTR